MFISYIMLDQGSHFFSLTKFPDFSRNFPIFPGINVSIFLQSCIQKVNLYIHIYIYIYIYNIYIKHGLHLLLGTDLNALFKKRLSYEEILHNKVDYIDSINLNITTPFYNTHIYIQQ